MILVGKQELLVIKSVEVPISGFYSEPDNQLDPNLEQVLREIQDYPSIF